MYNSLSNIADISTTIFSANKFNSLTIFPISLTIFASLLEYIYNSPTVLNFSTGCAGISRVTGKDAHASSFYDGGCVSAASGGVSSVGRDDHVIGIAL